MKRLAVGIWKCKACQKTVAGGAWTVTTTAAATVRRYASACSSLPMVSEVFLLQYHSSAARLDRGIGCSFSCHHRLCFPLASLASCRTTHIRLRAITIWPTSSPLPYAFFSPESCMIMCNASAFAFDRSMRRKHRRERVDFRTKHSFIVHESRKIQKGSVNQHIEGF